MDTVDLVLKTHAPDFLIVADRIAQSAFGADAAVLDDELRTFDILALVEKIHHPLEHVIVAQDDLGQREKPEAILAQPPLKRQFLAPGMEGGADQPEL